MNSNNAVMRVASDFAGGPVEESDDSLKICCKQTTPHTVDDVLVESLQGSQFASLIFEFRTGALETF